MFELNRRVYNTAFNVTGRVLRIATGFPSRRTTLFWHIELFAGYLHCGKEVVEWIISVLAVGVFVPDGCRRTADRQSPTRNDHRAEPVKRWVWLVQKDHYELLYGPTPAMPESDRFFVLITWYC